MLYFKTRSAEPEILDDFALEGQDLRQNLRELERVNRHLGGYRIVRDGLCKLLELDRDKPIRLIDVGCGGGDTLRYLYRWSERNTWCLHLCGVDANHKAIAFAREQSQGLPIHYYVFDVFSGEFTALEADVVSLNLFLHHFKEEEIVLFLKHFHAANTAILINDLQRSKMAYQLFRLVSRLLGFSHISRHDGKLSVKKSFTRKDWQRMLKKAGITHFSITWKWAFRYLVLVPARNITSSKT